MNPNMDRNQVADALLDALENHGFEPTNEVIYCDLKLAAQDVQASLEKIISEAQEMLTLLTDPSHAWEVIREIAGNSSLTGNIHKITQNAAVVRQIGRCGTTRIGVV